MNWKLILGRVVSASLTVGWAILLGGRIMLDLIGYSTAPEDVEIAQTRLAQFLGFLLAIPWWVLLPVALGLTMWLIWVSWPRQIPAQRSPAKEEDDRKSSIVDKPIAAEEVDINLVYLRQFIKGPLQDLHTSTESVFHTARNQIRGGMGAPVKDRSLIIDQSDMLFECTVRENYKSLREAMKLDDFLSGEKANNAIRTYMLSLREASKATKRMCDIFDYPMDQNPNLHRWQRSRDNIALEARKLSVHSGLEFMEKEGEFFEGAADEILGRRGGGVSMAPLRRIDG